MVKKTSNNTKEKAIIKVKDPNKQDRVYLDFASQTMPSKKVLSEMKKVSAFNFNPANLYKEGINAENILSDARQKIARVLGVKDHEIYFTGSGTLSCASAIFGVVNKYKSYPQPFPKEREKILPHIITSNIEHSSVLENIKYLESIGEIEATYIEADEFGIINPDKVKGAIKENTILVSIMYVNNEVGTVQDIKNISKKIKEYKKERLDFFESNFSLQTPQAKVKKNHFQKNNSPIFQKNDFQKFMIDNNYPYFHTDAAQAGNYLSLYIDRLGVDLLSLNGSKIYGPKSSGILFKKENVKISPFYFGGGQERNIFSGTVDIEKAIGMAVAIEEAQNKIKNKNLLEKIAIKRNNLLQSILENISEAKLIGAWNENEWKTEKNEIKKDEREAKRLANNISIWLPDFLSDEMVLRLDQKGFSISAGSACSAKSDEVSHVIYNICKNKYKKELAKKIARETARITIDANTEEKDLKRFVKTLKEIYYKFRK